MPSIELSQVSKDYGTQSPAAVDNLDLTIHEGDFMCILGPSGCGKTTTLRMIAGLEQPTSGSITVGGRILDSVEGGIFVPPEKREMGMVFQNYALWPHLTIRQNTEYGLMLRKENKEVRRRRADEVMETMGIAKYADRYPNQLSGGQQQRVALARMLAVNPKVMLLDEPLSNLDSRLRLEMRAELKRIHNDFGSTVVFVTHDQWEAMTLATRIAVMYGGTLQQIGSPSDIYDRPRNRFVAEFLGNPPLNVLELTNPADVSAHIVLAEEFARRRMDGRPGADSVAFRPESIRLLPSVPADDAVDVLAFDVTIFAVLPTGGGWTTEVVTPSGRHLYATTSVPPGVTPGMDTRIHIQGDLVHVFDSNKMRVPPKSERLSGHKESQVSTPGTPADSDSSTAVLS